MTPTTFRAKDERQQKEIRMLAFLLDVPVGEVLRRALATYADLYSKEIAAIEPEYSNAQAALKRAREAGQAAQGE